MTTVRGTGGGALFVLALALCERGRQACMHGQRAARDAVALGMDRTDGVVVVPGGGVEDDAELLLQPGDRFALIGFDGLDARVETDGLVYRALLDAVECQPMALRHVPHRAMFNENRATWG